MTKIDNGKTGRMCQQALVEAVLKNVWCQQTVPGEQTCNRKWTELSTMIIASTNAKSTVSTTNIYRNEISKFLTRYFEHQEEVKIH